MIIMKQYAHLTHYFVCFVYFLLLSTCPLQTSCDIVSTRVGVGGDK
jgi:hypothetical protein